MLQIIYPQPSIQLREEKCDYAYHLLLFVQNTKTDEWWKTDKPETKCIAKACN